MNNNNLRFWLEQEAFPGSPPAPGSGTVAGQINPGQAADTTPPLPDAATPKVHQDIPDITDDPKVPDLPEDTEEKDFEEWKTDFFKLAIKGDVPKLLDSINEIRDSPLPGPEQKFLSDNVQILLLRQDANIDKCSREVRKLIKQELDRNNPATSVATHITNTLEAYPLLNNILIKLAGLYALKGDLHRKFIGALTGSIQVGGAGNKEDLIYPETDYSINFSTRFYTDFGEIAIGNWSLQEDDPDRYLSESEVERLEEGSPEEKQVLRNRVVLESIAETFRNRAFLIHVVNPADGQIYALGWDVAEGLQGGYKEGKLVVRQKKSEFRDAMIDDDGKIIPLTDIVVLYSRINHELDQRGISAKEEIPFMERRHGKLYLTASLETVQELSANMSGFFMKEIPYQGNQSDLPRLQRCTPSSIEMLMRRC